MNSQLGPLFVALLAGGSSSALIALFRIVLERRKIGADADATNVNSAVVVSSAALEQMKAAVNESQRLQLRLMDAETKIDNLEKRDDSYQTLAIKHRDWDLLAVAEVKRLGGGLPEPPALNI